MSGIVHYATGDFCKGPLKRYCKAFEDSKSGSTHTDKLGAVTCKECLEAQKRETNK